MNTLLKNVHVINLERSVDRLAQIDSNLRGFGIKYELFNAIDGKKLTNEQISDITTPACRYLLCSKAMIGCSLSHINLWHLISQSQDKWHLVLEDDARFTAKTMDFFDKLAKSSVVEEDDIFINLWCNTFDCKGPPAYEYKKDSVTNVFMTPKYSRSMGGYLITRNTAKKLYDGFMKYKIDVAVDDKVEMIYRELGIKYITVRDNMLELDGNNNISTISPSSLYLLSNLLNKMGLHIVTRGLSLQLLVLNTTYVINGFVLIYIALLIFNYLFLHSPILYLYLLLELVISLIMV